jgi:hypothetical protein
MVSVVLPTLVLNGDKMKFNCDYFRDIRLKRLEKEQKWHNHFAWLPVRLGRNDCRWLETVERLAEISFYYKYVAGGIRYRKTYEYKEKK